MANKNWHERSVELFNKVSFKHIILVWLGVVIVFSAIFFFLSYMPGNGIENEGIVLEKTFAGFFNALYFSVITATATGYGDFVPVGLSKLAVIIEAISGLAIFGLMISKFVSLKQEVILEEIYDISFGEQINRLRSALYLYRADISKAIEKVDSNMLTKRQINDIWSNISTLNTTLRDVSRYMGCYRTSKNQFTKELDELNIELVINSLNMSIQRTIELLDVMEMKDISLKGANLHENVKSIAKTATRIYETFKNNKKCASFADKLEVLHELVEDLLNKAGKK